MSGGITGLSGPLLFKIKELYHRRAGLVTNGESTADIDVKIDAIKQDLLRKNRVGTKPRVAAPVDESVPEQGWFPQQQLTVGEPSSSRRTGMAPMKEKSKYTNLQLIDHLYMTRSKKPLTKKQRINRGNAIGHLLRARDSIKVERRPAGNLSVQTFEH